MTRDFSENKIINGRYKLKCKIGEGGFSEVWLAEDTFTDTEMAVKIYAPDKGLDKDALLQFKKEYRRTRGLRHPHLLVPDHFDILNDTSSPLLVLPYCSNGSLSERLSQQGAFNESELARLLAEICSGLAELHNKKIIHQDIKPGNVLIDENDHYQLTDFGISRQMRSTLHKATVSQSYLTVAYSPPERYIANPVDTPASDIFSMGVMAYELCMGNVPWDGVGGMVLNSGAQVPKLPGRFSNRLNTILQACVNRDYGQRPTAVQLKQMAETYLKEGAWPELRFSQDKIQTESGRAEHDKRRTEKMDSFLLGKKLNSGQTTVIQKEPVGDGYIGTKFSRNLNISVVAVFAGLLMLLIYFTSAADNSQQKDFEEAKLSILLKRDQGGFSKMKSLADAGFVPAHTFLGYMFIKGEGVAMDHLKAEYYLERAVEEGDLKAYYFLGQLKKEQARDFSSRAYPAIKVAAMEGDILWLYVIGNMLANGQGVPKDDVKAVEWYQKAAEKGYARAQNNIGVMYAAGRGVPKNDQTAVYWYQKAALQGLPVAQNNLGNMYYYGTGIAQSYSEAVKWYQKAANQGYAAAQNNFGVMHNNGEGVPKNYYEAFKWYKKAADQGYAYAQYHLGDLYYYGTGISQNYDEAFKWFKKAAVQGLASAQNMTGVVYDNGEGSIPENEREASRWYLKAAKQGNAVAQYNLGLQYYYGQGVLKNYNQARIWFQKAADNGYKKANEMLEKF